MVNTAFDSVLEAELRAVKERLTAEHSRALATVSREEDKPKALQLDLAGGMDGLRDKLREAVTELCSELHSVVNKKLEVITELGTTAERALEEAFSKQMEKAQAQAIAAAAIARENEARKKQEEQRQGEDEQRRQEEEQQRQAEEEQQRQAEEERMALEARQEWQRQVVERSQLLSLRAEEAMRERSSLYERALQTAMLAAYDEVGSAQEVTTPTPPRLDAPAPPDETAHPGKPGEEAQAQEEPSQTPAELPQEVAGQQAAAAPAAAAVAADAVAPAATAVAPADPKHKEPPQTPAEPRLPQKVAAQQAAPAPAPAAVSAPTADPKKKDEQKPPATAVKQTISISPQEKPTKNEVKGAPGTVEAALELASTTKPELPDQEHTHGRNIWIVVGGGEAGGLIVRQGKSVQTPEYKIRLKTGTKVEQMDVQGKRLHYRRLRGDGPDFGWVSIEGTGGKILMAELFEDEEGG